MSILCNFNESSQFIAEIGHKINYINAFWLLQSTLHSRIKRCQKLAFNFISKVSNFDPCMDFCFHVWLYFHKFFIFGKNFFRSFWPILHFWHISLLSSRKHTEPRCGWFVKFMFNCYIMSEYIIFSSLFIYCLCISATACCASFAVCLVCCICH